MKMFFHSCGKFEAQTYHKIKKHDFNVFMFINMTQTFCDCEHFDFMLKNYLINSIQQ